MLSSSAVDDVRPWYEVLPSRIGPRRGRLLGAEIRVQPVPGATPEALETALRCACAERLVHPATADAAASSDPFCLSDAWVDLEVSWDRREYLVRVHAEKTEQAKLLLDRSRRFTELPRSRPASDR